ncbi:MAG: Xaa-Pro peptidase family protein, partial [Planctomycetota bacterium]|nr:Xaa-Pro peptidase family protein [Planctomycetota bacterium]
LLLERADKATLIAENFSRRSAASEPFVDDEIIEKWYDHQHSVSNRDHALFSALESVSDRMQGRGLVEAEWLPMMAADRLRLSAETRSLELGSVVRELRRQKEPDEIALLESCMRACEAGHSRALEFVTAGVSELDVYREVQSAAVAVAGCPAIVYGDFRAVNAEIPKRGGLPTTETLRAGDMLILDYSVVLNGYRSDFTNTIAVGTPSAEQEQIFAVCEGAMAAGESVFKAGAAARDVYRAASAVMEEAGFSPLVHHAGHGLGLGHPEAPILVPESDDTLVVGDVVTLEPGLYVEGVGGVRIEHNYLISETGFRRLSNHRIALQ